MAIAASPAATLPPTIPTAAVVRNDAVITRLTAHTRNPFAVSRKCTSSVCTDTHRVRRRPARYPPIADETASTTTSQISAATPAVMVETPTLDHGEIADSSKPAPSASRMSAIAAATNAPPITAPHETPEEYKSVGRSRTTGSEIAIRAFPPVEQIRLCML